MYAIVGSGCGPVLGLLFCCYLVQSGNGFQLITLVWCVLLKALAMEVQGFGSYKDFISKFISKGFFFFHFESSGRARRMTRRGRGGRGGSRMKKEDKKEE